jgi:hypothetical protein
MLIVQMNAFIGALTGMHTTLKIQFQSLTGLDQRHSSHLSSSLFDNHSNKDLYDH